MYIYGCFSRYFSFVIDNAKPACLFFKTCINCSKSRKAHVWDNWSKQCTQEVLVMATELVSSTILFPTKKLFLWNENLNTFHRYLLKALLCILFKLDTGFFSCCSLTILVNIAWFCTCPCMLHNIYVSALWLPLVNPAGNTFPNSRMKY